MKYKDPLVMISIMLMCNERKNINSSLVLFQFLEIVSGKYQASVTKFHRRFVMATRFRQQNKDMRYILSCDAQKNSCIV